MHTSGQMNGNNTIQEPDTISNNEINICKVEDCSNRVRIKKLGLCQKHETRLRNYGDINYNKKIILPIELPNGLFIRNTKKIQLFSEIVQEVKKRRLCGYNYENWQIEAYIVNFLGDKISNRRGARKSGSKTKEILEYLDIVSKNYDKKWGLITYEMAEKIARIAEIITKNGVCEFDVFKEITDNDYSNIWQTINGEELHGIKYNSEIGKFEFSKSEDEVRQKIDQFHRDNSDIAFEAKYLPLINEHNERVVILFKKWYA